MDRAYVCQAFQVSILDLWNEKIITNKTFSTDKFFWPMETFFQRLNVPTDLTRLKTTQAAAAITSGEFHALHVRGAALTASTLVSEKLLLWEIGSILRNLKQAVRTVSSSVILD